MKTKETPCVLNKKNQLFPKLAAVVGFAYLGVALAANAGQGPQPSICTRACWGARGASCSSMSALTRGIIHHTAGAGDYTTAQDPAKIRAIQNYHMDTQGWCDIGYNFLVNAGGHIYEGRVGSMGGLTKGSHDGCNANSFGFNVTGYYHPPYNQAFTSAARGSLEAVIAWRMPSSWSPYGSGGYCSVTIGTLEGHYRVKSTACPGDGIIPQIPGIRDGVNARKNGGGETLFASPAITTRGPGVLDVFARGSNGALKHRYYYNGWSGWEDLGGGMIGGPAACSWGGGRLDIFIRGLDNHLYQKVWDGAAWSGFYHFTDGVITSDPAVCAWGPNRLDVFARGGNGALYHKAFDGVAWHGWANLGGAIVGAPAVAAWGPNRLDVFARGTDNQAWHWAWDGNAWYGPEPLGGAYTADFGVASWGSGRLDYFGRGGNNHCYHGVYQVGSGWWGPEDLGGVFSSGLDACSWGSGRYDVVGIGTDGTLWHNWYSGAWGGWGSLGAIP